MKKGRKKPKVRHLPRRILMVSDGTGAEAVVCWSGYILIQAVRTAVAKAGVQMNGMFITAEVLKPHCILEVAFEDEYLVVSMPARAWAKRFEHGEVIACGTIGR